MRRLTRTNEHAELARKGKRRFAWSGMGIRREIRKQVDENLRLRGEANGERR